MKRLFNRDWRRVLRCSHACRADPLPRRPAAADFRLCNNTASRIGVAVGYKDADGWTTEGWWNLPARTCETVLKGNLVARYYYVYAIDYDRGGEWMGQAYMCTRDKEFTIRGIGDCLARGYDRSGFFEVDTGEQRAWTVQLTESAEQPAQKAANSAGQYRRRPRRSAATWRPAPPASPPTRRRQRRGRGARRNEAAAADQSRGHARPGLGDRDMIGRLFEAGADVFRINMSHTNHDRMRELVATIRAVEAEHNRPIGILVDLQGPKLRLGAFADGAAMIDKGQKFTLDTDPTPGDNKRVQLPHPEIFAAIKPGDALLIDDGKLRLVATEVAPQRIVTLSKSAAKCPTAKASACPTLSCRSRRWRPRTSPTSKPPSMPASTGSRCRSFSGRKISPKRRRSPAAAPP